MIHHGRVSAEHHAGRLLTAPVPQSLTAQFDDVAEFPYSIGAVGAALHASVAQFGAVARSVVPLKFSEVIAMSYRSRDVLARTSARTLTNGNADCHAAVEHKSDCRTFPRSAKSADGNFAVDGIERAACLAPHRSQHGSSVRQTFRHQRKLLNKVRTAFTVKNFARSPRLLEIVEPFPDTAVTSDRRKK